MKLGREVWSSERKPVWDGGLYFQGAVDIPPLTFWCSILAPLMGILIVPRGWNERVSCLAHLSVPWKWEVTGSQVARLTANMTFYLAESWVHLAAGCM